MATTSVLIQDELGLRVPSVGSVQIVSGDSVTFTAGADSILYFSPQALAILSPAPDGPVSLPSGTALTYSFAAPASQTYGVIVQSPESPAPGGFDFGPPADPAKLVIQSGAALSFPGPSDPIKTGGGMSFPGPSDPIKTGGGMSFPGPSDPIKTGGR